ncbi:DUF4360 domain-containing protein [Actinoplanes sp. CA-252034]|uniref:DUF4360 domain-containing protein n=1 Tax=Actinoplanes sp. CA-252034 TaxID=3239906 RepID=UPI003D957239
MLHAVATGTALLVSLTATAAVPSSAASAPPPGKVTVAIVSANRSGCPAGTADVTAPAKGTSFKVTYRAFTASAGAGASPLDFRKNCQIALAVSGRKGWTWAISRIANSGSATLRSGASGTQVTSFYWAGDSRTGRVAQSFTGPVTGPWQRSRKIAEKARIYQPCGQRRHLNVNLELRVRSGSASGRSVLTLDSTTGSTFGLVWKKC